MIDTNKQIQLCIKAETLSQKSYTQQEAMETLSPIWNSIKRKHYMMKLTKHVFIMQMALVEGRVTYILSSYIMHTY